MANSIRFSRACALPQHRTSALLHSTHAFSTVSVPESKPVFNSSVHDLNKQRAASLSNSYEYDYFRNEVASRLVSRMLDLDGEFPVALDFGCHAGQIYKAMINFIRQNPTDKVPAGIKELHQIETCADLLHRDEIPAWQQQLIASKRTHMAHFDGIALPFEENTFDLVVTAMSLQWMNNIPFVFSEIARVIKPDGCFIGALSGGQSLQELRSSLLLADQERKGGMNSHMSPSVNITDISNLLGRAGFVMITVDNEVVEIPYPNMFVLCEHVQSCGDQHAPYLPDAHPARYKGVSKDVFIAAAAIYDALYADSQAIQKETRDELNAYLQQEDEEQGDENVSVDATLQTIHFMSWSPDPSKQRKPMQRGSAEYSLKDFDEITDIIEQKEREREAKTNDDDPKNDNDSDKKA